MNIKLPAFRLSCAINKKNYVTYECIGKDMFRRVECIDIVTHEDTMTKEVAAPTVTCICTCTYCALTPSCTVKVTKGVTAAC